MAEPVNLAPATPSAFYGVLPASQSPIFISVLGQPYMSVVGAKARCYIDLPYRDGSTHRNTLDASFMGRSPPSLINITSDLNTIEVLYGNGDATVGGSTGFPSTITPTAETVSGFFSKSDEVVGNPPWQTVKARTMIMWFDAVTPGTPPTIPSTANVVGACWADRYIDEGSRIPQFPGSAPPPFTP